jgi:hypothetical protein
MYWTLVAVTEKYESIYAKKEVKCIPLHARKFRKVMCDSFYF